MTLLQALSALGYDAPRWVSPSGRVVFTQPTTTALAVKPHTFHGGTDVLDADTMTAAWWEDQSIVRREVEAMTTWFPSFSLVEEVGLPPAWVGAIDTGYGRFVIKVQHRFDHGMPRVIPVSPRRRAMTQGRRVVPSPHLFSSGALCVADESDWNRDDDTAATAVAWAAHWHAAYVTWFSNGGQWPTAGLGGDV